MTAFSLHCKAGSGLGEREKKTLDVRLWYLCLKHPWKEMIFMVGGGGEQTHTYTEWIIGKTLAECNTMPLMSQAFFPGKTIPNIIGIRGYRQGGEMSEALIFPHSHI